MRKTLSIPEMSFRLLFMKLTAIISILFFVISASTSTANCLPFGKNCNYFREDYIYHETTNAFYKLNRASIPWFDAVTWCREEGAELAFPTSYDEVQILLEYFAHAANDIWLAFHDQYAEGIFISTNGTSITKLYNNWLMGQPDDAGEAGEDCVSLNKEGYYSDVVCNKKLMFVCKKDNFDIFLNSECQTHVPGYKLSPVTGRCYKVHPEARNWHEAFRICEAEMGSLADINSPAEAFYLVEELKNYPNKFLLGTYTYKHIALIDANEILYPNNYITRSGQTLKKAGYDKWVVGQPNKGLEHCGCMGLDNGLFYDLQCTDLAMFICEKDRFIN